MAKESGVWKWLRDGTKHLRRKLALERVENSVGAGRPDVNGHFEGGHTFDIELKRAKSNKTSDTVHIKWQPKQQPWLMARWAKGAMCWVLIVVDEGPNLKRFLVRGCDVGDLNTTSLSHLEEISVICPKASAADVVRTASGLQF